MRRRLVTAAAIAALCVGWYFFVALGHNALTMRHGGQGGICASQLLSGADRTPEVGIWSKHRLVPLGIECRYTLIDGSTATAFVPSAWGAVGVAPLLLAAVGAVGWAGWSTARPAMARRREARFGPGPAS